MEKDKTTHKTILKKQKSLPLRSKNVHFADVCGLSLVSVHKISMDDLTVNTSHKDLECEITKELTVTFTQPIAMQNFMERLNTLNVSLENVLVSNSAIMGTVKVKNITYEKVVFVRSTFNNWKSFEDCDGSYVPLSYDGNYDRFSFAITVPSCIKDGDQIEFAVCYRISHEQEFWDNNNGKNYIIVCEEKSLPRNPSYGMLWSKVIPNYKR